MSHLKLNREIGPWKSKRESYRGNQTVSGRFFCCHGLDINPMILKLECEMYLHSENEAATLKHSKLLLMEENEICMVPVSEKVRKQRSKVKVKCHQLPSTFSVHRGAYSYQITSISDQ